jgi:hypothetical protein
MWLLDRFVLRRKLPSSPLQRVAVDETRLCREDMCMTWAVPNDFTIVPKP